MRIDLYSYKRIAWMFFCLPALFAACQKEVAEPEGDRVPAVFMAGMEPESKVSINTQASLRWQDEDSLAVFDGTGKNLFLLSENDGVSASFCGTVSSSASSYSDVYPYSAGLGLSSGKLTLTLPSEQYVPAGACADPRALVCVARTTSSAKSFAFRNVFGLVKVRVPSSGAVTAIVLRGKNNEILSGRGTVTPNDAPEFTPVQGQNSVTLRPAVGETLAAGDYFLAVAPVTMTAGFSLDLVRVDGSTATKSSDKSLAIARNAGSNLDDIVTGVVWNTHILTREQLFAWNDNYSSWTANDVVTLDADIDMNMQTWTPHTFRGTFDGQGHKLYNISIENVTYAGLFSAVYGSVSNLVLGSSDGIRYDGRSRCFHETTTTTGWSYIGSVAARLMSGGSLRNIVNYMTLELGAGDTQKCCMGGIAGYCSSQVQWSFDGCRNEGAIRNLATTSSVVNNVVGGIVSKCDVATGLRGCTNKGTITIENPKVQWIGGIIGATNGYAAIDNTSSGTFVIRVEDCVNEGAIELLQAYSPCVGGIAGLLCGAEIIRCTNTGSIVSSAPSELKIGGIAGKFDKFNDCSLTDCTNGSPSNHSLGSLSYLAVGGTSYAYVGGILGNAPSAATGSLTMTGCRNYANLTTNHAYTRELGGIAGRLNLSGCSFSMTDCHNQGAIRNNAIEDVGENTVAGLVAYLLGKASACTIDHCSNGAGVSSNKPCITNGYLGGLVANGSKVVIQNSTNSGNVASEGAASSYMVGGIAGYLTNSTIQGCSNNAAVSDKMTAYCKDKYRTTGGILGRGQTSVRVEGCTNTGTVTGEFNTNNQLAAVAGIWGDPRGGCVCIGNVNKGAVVAANESTTNPYAFAGGVIGSDNESSGGAVTISGNINEANVTASTVKTAKMIGAGGLFGYLATSDPAGISADNVSRSGAIHAVSADSVPASTLGGAGAVCGVHKLESAWSCQVGMAVSVDGKTYSQVSETSLTLMPWICPLNSGGIISVTTE
ncbi:MAG: hypothetical protein IJR34_04210 [Bacteroidales bacterium]|nr:hypothetical protein [Bacteroidales bacterium]